MKITWSTILTIVNRMWGINQNTMAELLGVNRSTVSRLMSENQLKFNRANKEIYKSLFSHDESNSPAFKDNPNNLLRDLKDQIKEMGLSEETKGLENLDYEKYVMGLLRMAKENEPMASVKRNNANSDVVEIKNKKEMNEKNIVHISEQLTMEIFNVFNNAIFEYKINLFLQEIDPTNMMDFGWIENCESFIEFINREIRVYFSQDVVVIKSFIFQQVKEFADRLNEYTGYLALNMRPADKMASDIMVPLYREENEKAIKWALSLSKTKNKFHNILL